MGTPLITTGHQWVAFTLTRVERIGDSPGGEGLYVDTIGDEAETTTVYGCRLCDTPSDSPEAAEECKPNGDNA